MFSFLHYLYTILIFKPLYNGFIFIFDVFPWIDAGLAVILFTIVVRLILFPLSKKAVVTQVRMKEIEPELNKLKKTVTDKQEQALKVMALYKSKGVNPFSSFLLLLIQIPIIFSLYSIFINSGFPEVNPTLLYGFVSQPDSINLTFLGIVNVVEKSLLFAILAAVAQFLQLHFSLASNTPTAKSDNPSLDAAQNAVKNMKYIFPIFIFFFAYKVSAVVAIYLIVTSLFTLGQELVVRKHLKKHQPL